MKSAHFSKNTKRYCNSVTVNSGKNKMGVFLDLLAWKIWVREGKIRIRHRELCIRL